ncbi:LytR/AlgR family response regulator transcription factor [[Eubacterium] hominis]|uniref:LytR/AlgR family response regulator transcription factor n=1 Tax=[Eubacterium] hominis TaxID=2764325 RepID=UPI003A4E552F
MRIAICDNDANELERFIQILNQWNPTYQAECYLDGDSLLLEAGNGPVFNMVFLDIYMPKKDGMEVAKELKKISPETEIVFVTTSREFAIEAFSLHAMHYLVKPITIEGIQEAFSRLPEENEVLKTITIKIGREQQLLYLHEIMVIESADHKTIITLKNGTELITYTNLKELQDQLDENFLQLRRGLVVHMEYIDTMQNDRCLLRNKEIVLLSRKERASIRSTYDDYVFQCLSKKSAFERGRRS